jgi:hypothetical protein
MKGILVTLVALGLTGCATTSQNIQSTYVSPMTYQSYDCTQLSLEADRISRRVSELTGQIDRRASGDKTQTAVALVLFWPALFFLGDNEAQNVELAKLKGESEALQQASITRKCSMQTLSSPVSNEETVNTPVQDTYSQLKKIAKLKEDGVLTDAEFQKEKKKLLENQ